MSSFTESNLLFTFPDDWIVRQFDSTAAYQSLSGRGLKGVDFIALSSDERLWLVEVKNYRPRFAANKEYRAKRRPPQALGQHVWEKFKDSHRLLEIVNASIRKKWWFKLWYSFRSIFPAADSNHWFWIEAHRRASQPGAMVYVLWLETPEEGPDYEVVVRQSLHNALPADAVIKVVETTGRESVPFTASTSLL